MVVWATAIAWSLSGCSGADSPPPLSILEPAGGTEARVQDKNPDKSSSELVFRFELVHPEMAAGSDPSTDTSARLQARVLVRNTTSHTIPIKLRAIAGHELEWSVVDEKGGRFDPIFLPPPAPLPSNHPAMTIALDLPQGEERLLTEVGGISGFQRRDSTDKIGYEVLPVGSYEVSAKIRWDDRDVSLGPERLIVRPGD